MSNKAKNEIRSSFEIEGTEFEITSGTDDLAEHPGRVGLYIHVNWCEASIKTYFDNPSSLIELRAWIDQVHLAMKHLRASNEQT